MSDLNKVILIGRLTRDPEFKMINQTGLVNFSIANNRIFMSNNEKREEVNFFDCEAWGRLADTLKQYASKGTKLAIEGRLKQNTWSTPEGKKASRVSIHVESFQFLGGGQQQGQQNQQTNQGGYQNQQNYNQYEQPQYTPPGMTNPAPNYSPTPSSSPGPAPTMEDEDDIF